VGAGPGDPELLTRKAWRVLQAAEVVLHDDLVSGEILAVLPAAARVVNVGKRCGAKNVSQEELNDRMVSLARAGHVVVRLKNGDPLLFGRASEEIAALREAAVEFEIIPGVTAALGAAASAKVPLTDRRHTSRVMFITIHRAANPAGDAARNSASSAGATGTQASGATDAIQRERDKADGHAPIDPGTTYVVYMPGSRYADLAVELRTMGVAPQTPCLLISHATLADECIYRTTVELLARSPIATTPSLFIVGEVAAEYGVNAADEARAGMQHPGGWSAEILNFVIQPAHRRGKDPFQES
jgi:siroheme synthase